ncbi:hypothetical protein E9229_000114 [Paeniglutamicibacter cryotolerans]|uniref:Uncharacterized protein n=1 Tax=Paeniglutamicibacter cryotolerans TaxID=670079 RepID=A0A839QE98_9MICC|nr:hypothetical protein [Paeniglutamicibacter cryotolerans]
MNKRITTIHPVRGMSAAATVGEWPHIVGEWPHRVGEWPH